MSSTKPNTPEYRLERATVAAKMARGRWEAAKRFSKATKAPHDIAHAEALGRRYRVAAHEESLARAALEASRRAS